MAMQTKQLLIAVATVFFLSGCLMTADEIREDRQQPPSPEQVQQANQVNRLDEMDGEMRTLRGRVDTLENNLSTANTAQSNQEQALDARVKSIEDKSKIYEDELTKLDAEYLQISQKVETLHASLDALHKARATKKLSKKNSFQVASSSFAKKKWKEAIVEFQKYRELNPHGEHYSEATYKIGWCFYKLGMKPEARTFYSEAATKFGKSIWGKRAAKTLKALK